MAVDETTRLAETILALRHSRSDVLPSELFGEQGWEVLLILFVSDAHGLPLSAHAIAEQTVASPEACQRWLRYLAAERLVAGQVEIDGGSEPVVLSAKALEAVEQWLSQLKAVFETRWGARFDDASVTQQ